MTTPEMRWQGVNLALAILALDPGALGGLWLRARVGPVRDRVQAGLDRIFADQRRTRINTRIDDATLFGGVDIAATLSEGRVVQTEGVLQRPGVLVLPMAERTPAQLAARLATDLDGSQQRALIALDEGAEADERLPTCLADRLALHIDLTDHAPQDAPELSFDEDALADARQRLPRVSVPDDMIADITTVAARLGIHSLRAPLQALAVARASAALSGSDIVESPDLITAIELVLAPRATQMPTSDAEQDETPHPPEPETPETDPLEDEDGEMADLPPAEILLEAARVLLPANLLERLGDGRTARNGQSASGSGAAKTGNRRGRPLPSRPGHLGGSARVDLVATLRAAAPWQPLRRKLTGQGDKLHIRQSDLRVRRFEETSDRAIIFVVDASGSSAMARMGEAKGAVELLLGEAYARRDHVALVAFRGEGSDVLLPPTRSLVQTKRRLAQLAGGGGTPLAAGLRAAFELAGQAAGKGMTPSVALLTDGRANVDLSGAANRPQAAADAAHMARALRARGWPGIVIDTGLRPTRGLDQLAAEMGAPYVPLPRADARALSATVDAALTP